MKVLYTAHATAEGGRNGSVRSDDGQLEHQLTMPEAMQGSGGEGTNPEQLFAAGYSACFGSALEMVTQKAGEDPAGSTVSADVGIGPNDAGGFGLTVALQVSMPNVGQDKARELVEQAHQVCPYSNATRGNLDVDLQVV